MKRVKTLLMRNCVAVLALAVVLVVAPFAVAQNGASGPLPFSGFVAIATGDYIVTVSEPGFEGCQVAENSYAYYGSAGEYFGPLPGMTFWSVQGVDSAPPSYLHLVMPRSGAFNFKWIGDVATRVYRGSGIADLFKSYTNKCDFLEAGPLVAKGVARFNMTDADDSMTGPGAYQFGWSAKGVLDNIGVDGCGSTVQLTMLRRWVNKSTSDISLTKLTASKGPTLTCK